MRRSWTGPSGDKAIAELVLQPCRDALQRFEREGRLPQGAYLCRVPLHRARRAIKQGQVPALVMAVNFTYFSAIVPRRAFDGEPRFPNAAWWLAENPFLAPDIAASARTIPADDAKLGSLLTDLISPVVEYAALPAVRWQDGLEREVFEDAAYRQSPEWLYERLRARYRTFVGAKWSLHPMQPAHEPPGIRTRPSAPLESEAVQLWLLPPFVARVREISAVSDRGRALQDLALRCRVSVESARRTVAAMNDDGTWRRNRPSLPMLTNFRVSVDKYTPYPIPLQNDGVHAEPLARWLDRNPKVESYVAARARDLNVKLYDPLVNGVLNDVLSCALPLLAASRDEPPEAAKRRGSATTRFQKTHQAYYEEGRALSRLYPLMQDKPWQGISFSRPRPRGRPSPEPSRLARRHLHT